MNKSPLIESYLAGHPAAAEYRFLLECCRAAFAGKTVQYPAGVRTDVFLEIVRHHKLIPQLYPLLKNRCNGTPVEFPDTLLHAMNGHRIHILQLTGELVRLSDIFHEYDISWMCLKGPALSKQLYGDIAARQSGDLDILVAEKDILKAVSLLKKSGYRLIMPEGRSNPENLNLEKIKDFFFRHEKKGNIVELHRIVSYDWLTPDNITALMWENPEELNISGKKIPVPASAAHLTYLYEHGSRHTWYRLAWLWDIAYARSVRFGNNIVGMNFSKEMEYIILTANELCRNIFGIETDNNTAFNYCPQKRDFLVQLARKAMLHPEKTKSAKMQWLRLRYMLSVHPDFTAKLKSLKRYFR
jgi:hypothetical protein